MTNRAVVCANLRREFMVPDAFEFEGQTAEELRTEAQNFFDANIKPNADAAERRARDTAPTSHTPLHRGDIHPEQPWGEVDQRLGIRGDGQSKLPRMPR